MRKVLFVIIALLILVVVLIYVSLNYGKAKKEISVLVNIENVDEFDFTKHDSVEIAASFVYDANQLKTFMQGEHYRDAWSAPIKVPIVFLDTLFGGCEIVDIGGGKQTKSLELEAKNGLVYTLRSINKNPEPLVPDFVKTIGLENIIVDGISAQHPYSAIPVASLAESLGLLHTYPRVVFIPKQKALKKYNGDYGNKLFLLEYENKNKVNWTPYKNVVEIIDTDHLIELKNKKKDLLKIDEAVLVRNRLFDLVIGDWDRHAKQWGWVILKDEKNYLKAIPLAIDRDNAFFNVDGIIPNIISNPNIVKELRSFDKSIDYMPGLVQPFDSYFLLHTPESLFVSQAKLLQNQLTDETIESALKKWPKTIYNLNAEEIKAKLLIRRDSIFNHAILFKKILDEKGKLRKWPLKGCEDLKIDDSLKVCFNCSK